MSGLHYDNDEMWSLPPSYIHALPNEILFEISQYLPLRHPSRGYVVDASDLWAFNLASRNIHNLTRSLLYKEAPVTSYRQLISLAEAPGDLLSAIQELNIFTDIDFVEIWKVWARTTSIDYHLLNSSPYKLLAIILSSASNLVALRIRAGEFFGPRSAWRRFPFARAYGMPFGRSMGDMLGNQMLTQLKLIEMDGFQDLEPLMRLTPNLKVLRLTMSSGFSQSANAELVQALAHVPHLRELVFSPETLRLYTPFTEDNLLGDFDEITEVTENGTNVEIIKSIGKLVPELEILDLRNRWFGMKGMFFPPSVEPIRSNALVEAVKQLPNLRSLALPSSVVSLRDFTTIRAPPGIRLPPGFPTWDEAMEHIADAEVRTVQGIGAACNDIQNVAFTRPLSDALRLEYSVNYEVGIFQPHDLALSRGTARTEYPTHTDVHLPVISRADVDQEDASSCFGPSHALTGTLRTVWRASSPAIRKEKIIKLVKEHEFFVTVMLCVSVCVVAELGKIVLCMALDTKRAEVASSAVIAGGALFILSPLLQWQLPFESDR